MAKMLEYDGVVIGAGHNFLGVGDRAWQTQGFGLVGCSAKLPNVTDRIANSNFLLRNRHQAGWIIDSGLLVNFYWQIVSIQTPELASFVDEK